jgi:gamma-glutamylcyclotransferase (GGCT)/AIG2-like uncharacterized protein YtfP
MSRDRPAPRPAPPDLLFAYGTLMRGFPLHGLLAGRAAYVGEGVVAGRLFDLGRYPAAVPDPGARVAGELYRVGDPALWTVLDSAEGRQYHREQVAVLGSGGDAAMAFIYWFRGALHGAPIPGGDYRAHAPAQSIHHPGT